MSGQLELYQEAINYLYFFIWFLVCLLLQECKPLRGRVRACVSMISKDGCIPNTKHSAWHVVHVQ